ncbi:TM1802 family CRISPR-associated protein [Campylobacter sp.]|uniref:TM1802 family CRISPR-associated protein n=1 Tax=Campylobacter sp. TaxID=205 RepID=UPI00270D04B3|nr:TM1802 family CRISPR-associated protein [Campylobacter sp.]
MGDIIKIFSDVGSAYQSDEKRIKNKAYEYDTICVYLCDIETKTIDIDLNIPKDDLIICRFGVGANSGNLFPNVPLIIKDINKDENKFIKGILKSVENLLSFFKEDETKNNEILKILSQNVDKNFFLEIIDDIKNLEKRKKDKSKKVANYFSLSYQRRPISAYFKQIFETHITPKGSNLIYGFDMLSNAQGIGGDANLAFCSVNEMPDNLKHIKHRLLPLNHLNAYRVQNGFLAIDKWLSFAFYGIKMAILPTVISSDDTLFAEALKILEASSKASIQDIEDMEININEHLEYVAKLESKIPILNTILFYNKSNSAVDVLLQIDDVLPSFISHISDKMGRNSIKAFIGKDFDKSSNVIYLQNLFEDRLEIMNLLLSRKKINLDVIMSKYSHLIYNGSASKKYSSPINWGMYFNDYDPKRSIKTISRYQKFFNEIDVLSEKLILQKEFDLQNLKNKQEVLRSLVQESEFVKENDVLKAAYLLGMFCSSIIKWQYGINGGNSFNKWLNASGAITKESLERIWKKADETKRKLENTSRSGNANLNQIKECLIEILPQAFLCDKVVKSSYVTLAFAMGGSDFNKFIKDEKKENEDE